MMYIHELLGTCEFLDEVQCAHYVDLLTPFLGAYTAVSVGVSLLVALSLLVLGVIE